jgi:hypothetical protein
VYTSVSQPFVAYDPFYVTVNLCTPMLNMLLFEIFQRERFSTFPVLAMYCSLCNKRVRMRVPDAHAQYSGAIIQFSE